MRHTGRHGTGGEELPLFPGWGNAAEPASEGHSSIDAETAYDLTDLFERLKKSAFRSRFHLHTEERRYIEEKGTDTVRRHARDFIAARLAPAEPQNDGHQTPMRGHPVFIAQHATGCCCRRCLAKWHHIPAGVSLTAAQQHYIVTVIMTWIERELNASAR